ARRYVCFGHDELLRDRFGLLYRRRLRSTVRGSPHVARTGLPALHEFSEGLSMCRPIVESGRVEIGPVWPHQRLDLGINPNLIEEPQIAERAVQLTGQNGTEIDDLLGLILESNPQRVVRDRLKGADLMYRMSHIDLQLILP